MPPPPLPEFRVQSFYEQNNSKPTPPPLPPPRLATVLCLCPGVSLSVALLRAHYLTWVSECASGETGLALAQCRPAAHWRCRARRRRPENQGQLHGGQQCGLMDRRCVGDGWSVHLCVAEYQSPRPLGHRAAACMRAPSGTRRTRRSVKGEPSLGGVVPTDARVQRGARRATVGARAPRAEWLDASSRRHQRHSARGHAVLC